MGDHCAHFLFDTFRVDLRKGVFFYPFFHDSKLNKPSHFGTSWPEVRAVSSCHSNPGCRSPPLSIHQPVNPAEQSVNMMNGGKIMDKPLVTIKYKTANGSEICIEVSNEVKELLEQSDRQIRTQRRQDRRHLYYMDFTDGLSDATMTNPQADIADLIIKMESYKRLYVAMNQLSEIQRRRLLLHFVNNLTYRQIGDLEGINQGTVCRSIKRAIKQLQKLLAD